MLLISYVFLKSRPGTVNLFPGCVVVFYFIFELLNFLPELVKSSKFQILVESIFHGRTIVPGGQSTEVRNIHINPDPRKTDRSLLPLRLSRLFPTICRPGHRRNSGTITECFLN